LVLTVAAWHLAFRTGGQPPGTITAAISAPAEISWLEDGDALISLSRSEDVDVVLGVAHGLGRPWLMALYRQAALGRLAEWFGPNAVDFDMHVREMGIPEEIEGLPQPIVGRLQAYSAGVRKAQSGGDWALLPAAVTLNLKPEPWSWQHTLAIERLVTWLSTSLPADSLPPAFLDAREGLAHFLGLGESDPAAVWVTEGGGLYARLPVGDSGIPPIMTVSIAAAGAPFYEGATFPGLPYLFCGRGIEAAWCKPFNGSATASTDSAARPSTASYFAVHVSDGSQVTGSRSTGVGHVVLPGHGGGVTRLEWGVPPISDAERWFSLSEPGARADFRVASALGFKVTATGTQPLGNTAQRRGSVVMSSMARESPLLLERIDTVDDTLRRAVYMLNDAGSVAASSLELGPEGDTSVSSYLRNWDGRFSASSIAASLFDVSAAYGSPRALDSLVVWFGSDQRVWRWERDPAQQLRYPGWALSGLPNRFGPVPWLRAGHPTSPAWGPSRSSQSSRQAEYRPSAMWEASLGKPGELVRITYRRPAVPYKDFLGRYRSAPVRPEATELAGAFPLKTTRVLPLS
jgi:penicillin G amidase